MKNIAIVLAGGSGRRLGESLPKQFLKIAGKKVIEHTISVFQSHTLIDEIIVVSHPYYIREVESIVLANEFTKVKKILSGGNERYDSSLVAIKACSNDNDNLLFHDSVRPLVNERIIDDCIKALVKYNAVDVAISTTDTIIQVNDDNEIARIPSRTFLRNGQTPQAFKKWLISKAYKFALEDPNFKTTDDCGVVLRYLPEEPIFVVQGEQSNMKLTYKEDIYLLDKLFQIQAIQFHLPKLTALETEALNEKVLVVFGGHYGIGKEICNIAEKLNMKVFSFSRVDGVDISNYSQVVKALDSVLLLSNKIDYVVNTAGVLDKQPLCNMSQEEILCSINVNYLGAINIARASYQYLKETKGCLLLFASSSYTRGRSLYSLYSSSKAAVVNLTQALNEEWSPIGIRVNTIIPERTKTPMRTKNFGVEPDDTLLSAVDVAVTALKVLGSTLQGQIIDIKKK